MNENELIRLSDKVWSSINTIENQNLNRDAQIEIIRLILREELATLKDNIEQSERNKCINALKDLS